MTFDDLKHAQRERLLYLDRCFTWRGRANRRDLTTRFGVSVAQAAIDFRTYLAMAGPEAPDYDAEKRTYLARPDHRPLAPETLTDWDAAVRDRPDKDFCELPPLSRANEPEILARLSRAIADHLAIQIRYASMKSGDDGLQWIAPTCFASDRDYVPARIQASDRFATRPAPSPMPFDTDWHTIARIKLAPRKSLSPEQTRAVRREYGIRGETLVVEIRKALEFYIDRRWGLKQEGARLEIVGVDYVAPSLSQSR